MCCPGGEFQKLRLRGVKPMDEMQRKIAAEQITEHLRLCGWQMTKKPPLKPEYHPSLHYE